MDFLIEYGMFLLKTITFVVAIGAVIVMIVMASVKPSSAQGELQFDDLSDEYFAQQQALQQQLLDKKAYKQWQKQQDERAKEKATTDESRLFVLSFNGSVDAHEVEALREEITAILSIANAKDEVLLKLESGGGMVHGYGLAASQLARLKAHHIKLTIAVDKVAASGGYMMACLADHLIAAPFAIVGSVGVVAQVPNFHRLLKKNDIDFEQFTAGEFKRTVTMFGENTEKGRQKFQRELEDTHVLFKDFVKTQRPILDVDEIASGEHWFGQQALSLRLVDALQTSDDYIQQQFGRRPVYQLRYKQKQKLAEKLGFAAATVAQHLWRKAASQRIYP